MDVLDRFLRYVSFDTRSAEGVDTQPTTPGQKRLGQALADELKALGLSDAHMDEHGYVYAHLPASPGCEQLPALGLIAHMDTSPDASGAEIRPRIFRYEGGDVVLNGEKGLVMRAADYESLSRYVGQELMVTDGTTLLGADDKAGIAEIVSAAEYLLAHPERRHGPLSIAFTPDEEVGMGTDHFNLPLFAAQSAYTVDGGELGELEYENFNAASATVTVHGFNIHPGSAKGRMKNACLIAHDFLALLPPAETPAHTEGYEGFYHLCAMEGDETAATLRFIIRDHDREKFEARKAELARIAGFLNGRWGDGCVTVTTADSYYNMRALLEEHMELIHRAQKAMESVGVTPKVTPIRGGTDGARLTYEGLPCPNLSTGGLNFHGVHEYIPVRSLYKMVEVLVALVTES